MTFLPRFVAALLALAAFVSCDELDEGTTDSGTMSDGGSGHFVSVKISSSVAVGETFEFALGNDSIIVSSSGTAVAFPTRLAVGASYSVSQSGGPRTCTLDSSRTGTIGSSDIVVNADCGTGDTGGLKVTGVLRAPVGTKVTLQNNGGDDLALTEPPEGTDDYNALPFSFVTGLADGGAYAVTVSSKPAEQTCRVYKAATGSVPVASGAVKVGCEYTYDLVSRSTDDGVKATYFESYKSSIGGANEAIGATSQGYGEGRFVTFTTSATGMSPNGFRQVFWRDRWTGETVLVSANAAGQAGDANSDGASISTDGLTVVFESYATNLVTGDGNGVRDVFIWGSPGASVQGVRRLSVTNAGVEADGQSYYPVISGDGSFAAFESEANNLTGNGTNGNIIRRNVKTGTNTVVSLNTSGMPKGGLRPSISEDGNRIAFWSYASDLVAGDTNNMWDIFVFQASDNSMRRISLRSDNGERNQGSDSISGVRKPFISGNGRFVAYETESTNVVPDDTNGMADIFVVDLDGNLGVRRASLGPAGVQGDKNSGNSSWRGFSLSYDGTWIGMVSTATNFGTTKSGPNIFLRNLNTGEIRVITDSTFGADEVSVSRTAAYVSFGSASKHDSRFDSTGQFVYFTDLARAWWWID